MILAEELATYLQRPLVMGPRPGQVAQGFQHQPQIVDAALLRPAWRQTGTGTTIAACLAADRYRRHKRMATLGLCPDLPVVRQGRVGGRHRRLVGNLHATFTLYSGNLC